MNFVFQRMHALSTHEICAPVRNSPVGGWFRPGCGDWPSVRNIRAARSGIHYVFFARAVGLETQKVFRFIAIKRRHHYPVVTTPATGCARLWKLPAQVAKNIRGRYTLKPATQENIKRRAARSSSGIESLTSVRFKFSGCNSIFSNMR